MKPALYIEPAHFADLFAYEEWSTKRILSAVQALSPSQQLPALRLLSHLLRSQSVWLGRAEETNDEALSTWSTDDAPACAARIEGNARNWSAFLNTLAPGDFNSEVTYTNTKGERYTSTLREIVTHVINHSTHHRAQIALLLRQAGETPPATDYIVYARESERAAGKASQ